MKKKLLFAVMALMTLGVSAQTDYSKYLDKVMEKLEEKDCDAAQKLYNVYKDLSGKSASSIEVMITDCQKGPYKDSYNVGDKMKIDGSVYVVAYTRDNGKHGYAVLDQGWKEMTYDQVSKKQTPTLAEMKLIYANRDLVRLYDKYWTCTKDAGYSSYYYWTKDFSTGGETSYKNETKNVARLLLIHRF